MTFNHLPEEPFGFIINWTFMLKKKIVSNDQNFFSDYIKNVTFYPYLV